MDASIQPDWDDLDRLQLTASNGGDLQFRDIEEALLGQCALELRVCKKANELAGGYGNRYYLDQVDIFDRYHEAHIVRNNLSAELLETLMGATNPRAELDGLKRIHEGVDALKQEAAAFEDASPGYGICDVRHQAWPHAASIYSRAEKYLAKLIETEELRRGIKDKGFRFYVPRHLLEELNQIGALLKVFDGVEFSEIDLRSVDELRMSRLVSPSSDPDLTQSLSKNLDQIEKFSRDFLPSIQKCVTAFEALDNKMRLSAQSGLIAWNNTTFDLVFSTRVLLSSVDISPGKERVMRANPVLGGAVAMGAVRFMKHIKWFSENLASINKDHDNLIA